MSDREPYVGQALQGVDEKARLAIPAAMRAALDRNAAEGSKDRVVVITTHETDPCLIGFDEVHLGQMLAEVKARETQFVGPNGQKDFSIRRQSVGVVEKLSYDASGRFVLQPYHRFHASLDGFALFQGVGEYFEIWDPRTLVEWPGAPEVMRRSARFLMAQKGITL